MPLKDVSEIDKEANRPIATNILAGGGKMGALMRSIDWSKTPLGAVEQWPQSLKTVVGVMLNSRYPMFIWWGKDRINLYNDGYIPVLGAKHPNYALGLPAVEVWSEIWAQVGPLADIVMLQGEATFNEDFFLVMERKGYPEETYFTFSYSPIQDEQGAIGGLYCACTEETKRVMGDRQLAVLRELAVKTADARTLKEICSLSADCLANNPKDLPFVLLYLKEPGSQQFHLAGLSGLPEDHPTLLTKAWPLEKAIVTNQIQIVDNLQARFQSLPFGGWDKPPHQAIVMPISQAGQTTGALVAALNPYRLFDDAYRGFMDLVVSQISNSMTNVRAYEDERKRAEALAEIDRAKTAFFSNVSHEFRTPLTLMLGPIEEVLHHPDTILENQEKIQLAHRNALRLQKLVNSLLDFSRIEAGRVQASYQPTDLAAYTAELASTFRSAIEKAGLKLIVDCPSLPELIYLDRDMWEKIVLNLLSNALKHTFKGEITVALRWLGDRAEFTVQDTGIGVSQDQLPHLFARFHRIPNARSRTHEGTGIGLALVQELVKLHGGTIHVESSVDRGTVFTTKLLAGKAHLPVDRIETEPTLTSSALGAQSFIEEALRWLPMETLSTLPITVNALASPSNNQVIPWSGALHPDKAHILLADDNADMLYYVSRLLEPYCEVEAVSDGQMALDAAVKHPPDLILSDVMMPKMDGFELLSALRNNTALQSTPVILLSARAGEEAKVVGLKTGADDYLVKPFSAQELLARVKANLDLAKVRYEAKAKLEQSNKELEQFATIASHDLKAPLRKIATFVDALKRHDGDRLSKEGLDSLVRIERSAEKMQDLINDLLSLSSVIRQGKPFQPVDLQKLISDIASDLQNDIDETRGRIEVGALPIVQGDETQLRQLLQNLIENGLKFHRKDVPPVVQISFKQPTQSAFEIVVQDNGIGFEMQHAERVFQIFERLHGVNKYPGTGVGLAIVKKIAERHGGKIIVESQFGEGSAFILTLPCSASFHTPHTLPDHEKSIKEVYSASLNLHTRQTILVLEDDPDLLDFACNYLTTLNYEVLSALDAEEAFAHLERSEAIHLLFSDIRLPGGANGIAIAQKAKKLRPDIQVLMTTGFDETILKETNQDKFPVLLKPYYLDDLAQTIYTLLNAQNGG